MKQFLRFILICIICVGINGIVYGTAQDDGEQTFSGTVDGINNLSVDPGAQINDINGFNLTAFTGTDKEIGKLTIGNNHEDGYMIEFRSDNVQRVADANAAEPKITSRLLHGNITDLAIGAVQNYDVEGFFMEYKVTIRPLGDALDQAVNASAISGCYSVDNDVPTNSDATYVGQNKQILYEEEIQHSDTQKLTLKVDLTSANCVANKTQNSGQGVHATKDFQYGIYLVTPQKPELFSGVFEDKIMVTLLDI